MLSSAHLGTISSVSTFESVVVSDGGTAAGSTAANNPIIALKTVRSANQGSSEPASNIITLGYQQRRGMERGRVSGAGNLENYFPNTIVNYLKSHVFQLLLSRIGDQAMMYILVYGSLFVPVGDNSLMQVSGQPVYELLQPPAIYPTLAPPRSGAKTARPSFNPICNRSSIFYSTSLIDDFPEKFLLKTVSAFTSFQSALSRYRRAAVPVKSWRDQARKGHI